MLNNCHSKSGVIEKRKKAERGKGIKTLNKSNTDEPIKVLRATVKGGFKKIHREALAHRGAEEC